jgi:hypothetical protein
MYCHDWPAFLTALFFQTRPYFIRIRSPVQINDFNAGRLCVHVLPKRIIGGFAEQLTVSDRGWENCRHLGYF